MALEVLAKSTRDSWLFVLWEFFLSTDANSRLIYCFVYTWRDIHLNGTVHVRKQSN